MREVQRERFALLTRLSAQERMKIDENCAQRERERVCKRAIAKARLRERQRECVR